MREVDGHSHEFEEVQIKDRLREKKLLSLGFHMIRFSAYEVNEDLGGVVESLTVKINRI